MTSYSIGLDMHPGSGRNSRSTSLRTVPTSLVLPPDTNSAINICRITFISSDFLWEVRIIHFTKRRNWMKCFQVPACHLGICVLTEKQQERFQKPSEEKGIFPIPGHKEEKVVKNNYKLQVCSPGAVETRFAEPFHPDEALGIANNKPHNFCLVKQQQQKKTVGIRSIF